MPWGRRSSSAPVEFANALTSSVEEVTAQAPIRVFILDWGRPPKWKRLKFIGREACAGCHAQKSRSQSHTAMAQALKTAAESEVLRSHARMTFRSGQYSFEIVSEGGQKLYRVSDGKETMSEPILYSFGDAHVAQT